MDTKKMCELATFIEGRRVRMIDWFTDSSPSMSTSKPRNSSDRETFLDKQKSEECGTACCIAGWAMLMNPDLSCSDKVAEHLGLNAEEKDLLFFPFEGDRPTEFVEPHEQSKRAVQVLRGQIKLTDKWVTEPEET